MATDYSKKTNADLVEILKARSLPHTGKKADLVARIQEDDEKTSSAPAAKTDAAEDVIDWDDDVPAEKPSTEAGANAIAAGGKGPVANPVAVPNQKLDIDPATTEELKVESTGAAAETGENPAAAIEVEQKPAVDYTKGLPTTDLEAELAKRKARAAKFGIVEDEETAVKEAEKQLERAKRFGAGTAESTTDVGVKGLDEALPEKSRKRGRTEQGGRGGKRRDQGRDQNRGNQGNQGNAGRQGNQNRNAGNKGRNGGGNRAPSGQPKSFSEQDVAAMEARKKRFTTAA